MFQSPEDASNRLRSTGYLADPVATITVYLAAQLHKPLLLEGPAGSGKTQLAYAVAEAANTSVERLQCYEGVNEEKAIGKFDEPLQRLCVELRVKSSSVDWEHLQTELHGEQFFSAGPLLSALKHEKPCVLLIDELDKVDYAFEAMLLELLSVWTLSIPKLGTVHATSIPHVFLTSNQERRLGDPLRRRSFYLVVEHPDAEREAAIVAERTPKASVATHRFIAGLAKSLRAYTLEKPPSISEMNDVAMAMELLQIDRILPQHKEIMLPLIAKTEGDRKRLLMKEAFESIVRMAGKHAEQIAKEDVSESEVAIAGREIQK